MISWKNHGLIPEIRDQNDGKDKPGLVRMREWETERLGDSRQRKISVISF